MPFVQKVIAKRPCAVHLSEHWEPLYIFACVQNLLLSRSFRRAWDNSKTSCHRFFFFPPFPHSHISQMQQYNAHECVYTWLILSCCGILRLISSVERQYWGKKGILSHHVYPLSSPVGWTHRVVCMWWHCASVSLFVLPGKRKALKLNFANPPVKPASRLPLNPTVPSFQNPHMWVKIVGTWCHWN